MSEPVARKRMSRSFVINLIGAVIPLVVAIATVPLYVEKIGHARFGVLSIVWVLVGYLGFMDLGLSRASANAMARAANIEEERTRILGTALTMNFFMSLIGGTILYYGGGYVLHSFLSVPDELLPEVRASVIWIATLVPVIMLFGVSIGALEAREEFFKANVLQVFSAIFGQIVPVIVALTISPTLTAVIPAVALSRLFCLGLVLFFVTRSERTLTLRSFDASKALGLLRYGGWVSISSILAPILTTMDQMVIGKGLGVALVTFYAVPMTLVTRSQILTTSVARSIFPRLSSVARADAIGIAERAMTTSGILYGACAATGILLMHLFLNLWMGHDFATAASETAVLLLAGAWLNSLSFVPGTLMQAQGQPDLPAKLYAAEAIPYFGLLFWMTAQFGIVGTAIAYALRALIDFLLHFLLCGMARPVIWRLVPTFLLILAALVFEFFTDGHFLVMALGVPVVWIASLISLALHDPHVIAQVTGMAGGFIRKLRARGSAAAGET